MLSFPLCEALPGSFVCHVLPSPFLHQSIVQYSKNGNGFQLSGGFRLINSQRSQIWEFSILPVKPSSPLSVPTAPVGVRVFSGVVVWGPPALSNGVLTGYQLRFTDSFSPTTTVNKLASESYHVVTSGNLGNNIQVQVHSNVIAQYLTVIHLLHAGQSKDLSWIWVIQCGNRLV